MTRFSRAYAAALVNAQKASYLTAGNLDFNVPVLQPSKYRNVNTDGFDSKREAKRAAELRLLERSGEITDLRFQVQYLLIPAQYEGGKCVERACDYFADFVYVQDGKTITEDAKGMRTRGYIVKRKLMRFVHSIAVREV